MPADKAIPVSKELLRAYLDQAVLTAGAELADAGAAMLMLHGRGAQASDILGLSAEFKQPGLAFLAPQAPNFIWYPQPFHAPLSANQPWLDAALARLGQLVADLALAGLPPEKIFLLGFSQGASLSLEYTAHSGQRWAGVFGLSGSVIGPPGGKRADLPGLAGTPVFLGCSNVDPYIPRASVMESAQVLSGLGAEVETKIYPGLGHTINADEIRAIRTRLNTFFGG